MAKEKLAETQIEPAVEVAPFPELVLDADCELIAQEVDHAIVKRGDKTFKVTACVTNMADFIWEEQN
jgi:hypothetical protein